MRQQAPTPADMNLDNRMGYSGSTSTCLLVMLLYVINIWCVADQKGQFGGKKKKKIAGLNGVLSP